ncbi:hypothetical protein Ddc_09880 [Ditylenchus destructor]|nr:hypothetical protein Ddc_09880 [Ditylenchus destructor]
MHPYLGPTVRISDIFIYIVGDSTYNPEHIAEMESIAYLWYDGSIGISNYDGSSLRAEDFLPILNSPNILQCESLEMENAHFSFKDYDILYSTEYFELEYDSEDENEENDPKHYHQFLEQPGDKPIVVLQNANRETIDNLLDRLSKAFSSAVEPNEFKIVFAQDNEPLTAFRETNKTSGEILELKKGLPVEYEEDSDGRIQQLYARTLQDLR